MGCSLSLTCFVVVAGGRWHPGQRWHSHAQQLRDLLQHCQRECSPFELSLKVPPSPHWAARFTDMLCVAPLCVRREYADATEHTTVPRPIAPLGCSLLLTCLLCLAVRRWRLHQQRHSHAHQLRDLLQHCHRECLSSDPSLKLHPSPR
jgi:hypothetical protein